jgi:hypothetical protein
MEVVTPNVKASVESALMLRWDKRADTEWEDGKLVPWVPDDK